MPTPMQLVWSLALVSPYQWRAVPRVLATAGQRLPPPRLQALAGPQAFGRAPLQALPARSQGLAGRESCQLSALPPGLQAQAVSGSHGAGQGWLPDARLQSLARPGVLGLGLLTAPTVDLHSRAEVATRAQARLRAAGLAGRGQAQVGVGGRARPSAAPGQLVARAVLPLTAPFALSGPLAQCLASGLQPLPATTVHACNLAQAAVTELDLPLQAVAQFGPRLLLLDAEGLWQWQPSGLAQDEDGPVAIEVWSGRHDAGPALCRAGNLYASLRADASLQVGLRVEGQAFVYPLGAPGLEGLAPVCTEIGRGLRARYWQLGLRGRGVSFQLASLALDLQPTARRR